jgi:excinuclease UvrABC nuclease subunit
MTNLSDLPPVSAIYHVFHQGRVVYVGQTMNLKQRWRNHHIHHELHKRYGNDWHVEWVEVSVLNLDRAEAYAYREFRPELNKRNPSVSLGKAV